jgi:CHAT domain-containing protein
MTSSYTPTLTTLLELYQNSQMMFQGLLAVAQPCTPGQSMLPNARKELANIEFADACLQTHTLSAEQATVDIVVAEMKRHSWVHLACHATQDAGEPTQSAFLLHDGRLALSRLITESFPYADFAFLSACQTAAGDSKLSEEAVHLAAGMLSSGYRSVIATMWSIQDLHAPLVASEVYHHLVHNSLLNSTSAAHALHHAVKHLRGQLGESGHEFVSWVPYIHVGI